MKMKTRLIKFFAVAAVIIVAAFFGYRAAACRITGEITFATLESSDREAGIYVYDAETENIREIKLDGYSSLSFAAKCQNGGFFCVGTAESDKNINVIKVKSDKVEQAVAVHTKPDRLESFLDGVLMISDGKLIYLDFKSEKSYTVAESVYETDGEYQMLSNGLKAIYRSGDRFCLLTGDSENAFAENEITDCAIPKDASMIAFADDEKLLLTDGNYKNYYYNIAENKLKSAPSVYSFSKNDELINNGKTALCEYSDSALGSGIYIIDMKTGLKRKMKSDISELYDSAYDFFWNSETGD